MVKKNPPVSARDVRSITGSGRYPEGGSGNALRYSCLKSSMNPGAWQGTVYGVAKSWTQLSRDSKQLAFRHFSNANQPIPHPTCLRGFQDPPALITQAQVADTYVPRFTEIIQTQLFKIKVANIESAYPTSPYLSCGNRNKGSWLNFPHYLSLLADPGASLYRPACHFQGPVRVQKFFVCDRCFHACVSYQT